VVVKAKDNAILKRLGKTTQPGSISQLRGFFIVFFSFFFREFILCLELKEDRLRELRDIEKKEKEDKVIFHFCALVFYSSFCVEARGD